jgi:group I intron endonuclease
MRLSKLGVLNPMFNKEKSLKFYEQMYRNKSGVNNPMFGKSRSPETLAKVSKRVLVYNAETNLLIKEYKSIKEAKKDLQMGYDTLKKYCTNHKVFKGKIFSYVSLY